MQTPVGDIPPEVLKQLMAERGLLAYGGNYRMLPFSESDPSSATSAVADPAAPNNSPSGTLSDGSMIDPATGAIVPQVNVDAASPNIADANSSSDWWKYLLAATGTAGAAALANRLLKGRGEKIPLVEGETIDGPSGNAVAPEGEIIDGEFRAVDPRLAVADQSGAATVNNADDLVKSLVAQRMSQEAPTSATGNAPSAIEDKGTPPRHLTRRTMAERRLRPEARQSRNTKPAIVSDAYNDLSDLEKQRVNSLADTLIARRKEGNARLRAGKKGVGRRGLPTGPTDKESLVNSIARILRETGSLKSLQSAFN